MDGEILVVEDDAELADLYAGWLAREYDVRVANTGMEAVSAFDDDVEVVLLDRRLPDMNGAAVLSSIRDRDADPRVAMVTAVDPGWDLVDASFDAYLTKPVREADLFELLEYLTDEDKPWPAELVDGIVETEQLD